MRKYIEEACDQLDAALFSGDGFHDPEALAEFEQYLTRWQRGVAETKDFLKTLEEEEETEDAD